MTDRKFQKWFVKFFAGDYSLDDAPQSGRQVEVDSDQIETLIESNPCYTTREIADILKISESSVENHLHQLGYVHCFDVWVPHNLSEKQLLDRISTRDSLLKRNENIVFLKQIGDTVQQCGMEEIVGQAKRTTTNHTKGRSSSKEDDVVYMVGLEESPL